MLTVTPVPHNRSTQERELADDQSRDARVDQLKNQRAEQRAS